MQITVTMNMKDVYRMLRHVHLGQHKILNNMFFGFSIASLIAAVYVLFTPQVPIKTFYPLSVVPLLYLLVIPMVLIFQAQNIILKQEAFKKPMKYRFLDKGVEITNSKARSLIEWGDLHRVDETGQDFIFFMNRATAFSLPKSKIVDKEGPLKELLEEKLADDKFRSN